MYVTHFFIDKNNMRWVKLYVILVNLWVEWVLIMYDLKVQVKNAKKIVAHAGHDKLWTTKVVIIYFFFYILRFESLGYWLPKWGS